MRISIAMATFNGGQYLREQLDSFKSQERTPDELVVCDDGSTDDTLSILDRFKSTAPFEVNVISNDRNLGYTKNFEKAISHCSGDVIFLADQDDIWYPTKIGVLENAFRASPDMQLVIHDGELVDEDLVSHGVTKRSQVLAGYGSDDSFITGALTAIRREFLPCALPIPDGIKGHDGWLHNIARLLGKRMVIDQSLQYIRRHSTNTSSWVASSLEPINKLTVAKSQLSSAPSHSYGDRLLYNGGLIDRFNLIQEQNTADIPLSLFTQIYDQLLAERKAIINRDRLIHLGFFARKTMALKMLAYGEYAHFNGLKSFARDVFR